MKSVYTYSDTQLKNDVAVSPGNCLKRGGCWGRRRREEEEEEEKILYPDFKWISRRRIWFRSTRRKEKIRLYGNRNIFLKALL